LAQSSRSHHRPIPHLSFTLFIHAIVITIMSSDTKFHHSKSVALGSHSPEPTQGRFSEPCKLIPVAFVSGLIAAEWFIYMYCHCLPLMDSASTYSQGQSHFAGFNLVAVLLLTCYIRSILQHPGSIPDVSEEGDVNWEFVPQDARATHQSTPGLEAAQLETKRLGARRSCKWCNKFKPDRCHHCRVCRMCILKMDHHCPWIYNCVGFNNFKYFFLLVMYAAIACHVIVWTMKHTVVQSLADPMTPFASMFLLLLGEAIAAAMGFVLTAFLGFHISLMFKGMTTIEFCEKSRHPAYKAPSYDLGVLRNIKAVLGDNVLFWLLPVSPPSGDGVTHRRAGEKNRLLLENDVDAHGDSRRKTHERATYATMKPRSGTGAGEAILGEGESNVAGV